MGRRGTKFDREEILAYLEKNIDEPNERGCRLWLGDRRGNPRQIYNQYPVANIAYKKYSAHRLQWELLRGPLADGMKVCHHCDEPLCMNIEHHFEGTAKDNTRDMISKGRAKYGASHPCAKLTDDQVAEIRMRRVSGETIPSLARAFSVGNSQIHRIIHGRNRTLLPAKGE